MSLRDELTAPTSPTSFRILLPPGWRQSGVDEKARFELEKTLRDKFRSAALPEAEAEIRRMIRRYWAQLQKTSAVALYMPTEDAAAIPLPISMVAARYTVRPGLSMEEDVRSRAKSDVLDVELPTGRVFRWMETRERAGDDAAVLSRNITHVFPVPGENPTRGMMLMTAIPHLADGGTDGLLDPLTILSDSIAETFRWM